MASTACRHSFHSATCPPMLPPKPCLPTRAPSPPAGPDWLHEIKHDGFRMIVWRDGERVRVISCHGRDWGDRFLGLSLRSRRLRCARGESTDGWCSKVYTVRAGVDHVVMERSIEAARAPRAAMTPLRRRARRMNSRRRMQMLICTSRGLAASAHRHMHDCRAPAAACRGRA